MFATADLVGVGTNKLSVRLFMDAREPVDDFTRARGTSPDYLIYVAPPGQCIFHVPPRGTHDELRYRDNDHDDDRFDRQVPGSFVHQWRVVGDTEGDDAGVDTGVAVGTFTLTLDVGPC